ncbi:MAG TPA: cyclopropane-fatty-acyl-phospholipid synthase family protein [Acidobacteriota bacterium]|nr:cyclopropane-fatty-acyl-phospholipid synthase family protein [Acidobacteriota bacterium]
MSQIAADWKTASRPASRPSGLQRLARRILISRLSQLRHGRVVLSDAQGQWTFGAEKARLCARVEVVDPAFYPSLLGGSVGAGESYMRGEWKADDLTRLMRIMLLNRGFQASLESGWAGVLAPLRAPFHWLHKNTRRGSRRNIAAHYDLGNEFFKLFLSSDMMYSCALYQGAEEDSLEEASRRKLETICRKLELQRGDHLLEIGTGWGGMAVYAASRYGCRVTTTTISRRQYQAALERVKEAGLQDRVRVLLEDYRNLGGRFDKLVSIEMIEAVGHHYFDTYFRKCSQLLKPQGMMLLQAITISDAFFEQARRNVDFIKRYIFPGSCLPSVASICRSLARMTDLKLFHLDDITPHYARTLRDWRERFSDNLEAVRKLGFSEDFIRMWEFYLCYCEGGFAERYIGDVQMLLAKPHCRRRPLLDNALPGT